MKKEDQFFNQSFYLKISFIITMIFAFQLSYCQHSNKNNGLPEIDPKLFADNAGHWYGIFDKSNIINPLPGKPQYKPTQLTSIGDNILLFQKTNGGWPKNYDVFAILTEAQRDSVARASNDINESTFDNASTYTQIAALAIVYHATKFDRYKVAALKGLDYLLFAQYQNGGWPQFYPLRSDYSREITFNDDVFQGIMELLKDILDKQPHYDFIDDKYRKEIRTAFDKGIDCILKSQINDNGKLTAWCQQYDEVTLLPAWARKFEPPSICNRESAELVLFLMTIDHPSKSLINAIQSAVTWFQESKIYYTRVKTVPAPVLVTPFRVSTTDKIVVTDSTAPPIWTRFYELKTHRPLFCNRDSKVVYNLSEVLRERRDGYGWYIYNPQAVLDKYPEWKKKWSDLNILRISSSHTSFPDTARKNGHIYQNILYDASNHYADSSVLIIHPKKLTARKKIDLVFWFHGWRNNIDSANERFGLANQLASSGLNAVLVLAETTKDAPDSYGGKLELQDMFKSLVNDVLLKMKDKRVIPRKCKGGNIILAGHSGAYRVIAHILQKGGQPVKEVILFDALYGETAKYFNWIQSDPEHRLINIYTDGGGTDGESRAMVNQLITKNIRVDTFEEKDITSTILQTKKIVFIHSLKEHNEVINQPDNLRLFLENNPFLKKLKK